MEGDGELVVPLPSGAGQPVMNAEEARYLIERVRRYQEDNALANMADQQELDRIIINELLCHRWSVWLGQGHDYQHDAIDEAVLTRDLGNYSVETRQLKKGLGLDKPARDRQKGEGSLPDYMQKLLIRAKAFGIMRNEQSARATELLMELIGIVTVYRNCEDDEERKELRVLPGDVLEWIWEIARPEIEEIDRKFRQDGPEAQRMWIRAQ